MQAVRDQLTLYFIQATSEIGKFPSFNIQRCALVADEEFKVAAFVAVVGDGAIAFQKGF